jgi:hypothetical protein
MLVVLLAGCGMGAFTTEDGPDRVRGALYFEPDSTLSLQLYGARQAYVVLANSTLPCWPADGTYDPDGLVSTEDQYWQAQAATAVVREGARFVAFTVAIDANEDWLGRYALQADAWEPGAMAGYVADEGRVASGAWIHVIESAVEDGAGLNYALSGGITIVEEAHEIGVPAPAWLEIDRKDTEMAGTFDLAPTELSGAFRAERCENQALLGELSSYLTNIAIADGALLEFDDSAR